MTEGSSLLSIEFNCGEGHDSDCPCYCHIQLQSKENEEVKQTIRLLTDDGIEFTGYVKDVNDVEAQIAKIKTLQSSNESTTNSTKVLQHLTQTFPLLSRPYFETRRRRRVPKTSSAVITLATPIVDDFYLNLLDWSSKNVITITSGPFILFLRPRIDLGDFEIVAKFQNTMNARGCDYDAAPSINDASMAQSTLLSPALESIGPLQMRSGRQTSASTSPVGALMESDYTAVKWAPDGLKLAIGCRHGAVELWDAETQRIIRTMSGHTHRVGAIDWIPTHSQVAAPYSDLVSTGSRDKIILCHDIRAEQNVISILDRHKQEVCGLAWRATCSQDRNILVPSPGKDMKDLDSKETSDLETPRTPAEVLRRDWERANDARPYDTCHARRNSQQALYDCLRELLPDLSGRLGGSLPKLASGGNDNKVYIWDLGYHSPIARLSVHQAAVKALTWAPCSVPLLVSGGGTNDRCIRLWDIACKKELATCETESQVCNLYWSPATLEIISSHGYTLNQVNLWDLRRISQSTTQSKSVSNASDQRLLGFRKLATLTGHTARVLYMAGSPNGRHVCTAAGDGSVRLWSAFMDETENNFETVVTEV